MLITGTVCIKLPLPAVLFISLQLISLDDQHIHSKVKKDQCTAEGSSGIEPPVPVVHAGLGHPNNAR